jgi:hypothetical protein
VGVEQIFIRVLEKLSIPLDDGCLSLGTVTLLREEFFFQSLKDELKVLFTVEHADHRGEETFIYRFN